MYIYSGNGLKTRADNEAKKAIDEAILTNDKAK